MSPKKWLCMFFGTVLLLAVLLAAFNFVTDPFGAFGDRFLQWFSYDETNNPRVAKTTWLEQHHDEYDSYILGCSSTSSLPVEAFNEYLDASFYNLFMYGADMRDCEKIARYLVEHYEVKNLVLNVYIDNGVTYDDESNGLTHGLHYAVDPDTSALEYFTRYLFADPRYGLAKLQARGEDTILPQTFDVFDEATGVYDKRARDAEPIGSLASYLQAYPVFADYPQSGPYGLYQTASCMESVAAIRDLCAGAGVNLIVVAGPVYIDYFDNFAREDVAAFYEALAEVTPFWDFSCSSVSCEPRYFYDATHFRNNVGEMIAARIFGGDAVWMPDDFGTYVTADNAAEHFAASLEPTPLAEDAISAQVPILMYHNLAEEGDGGDTMSAANFEAQIRALAENGYTAVTFDDLMAYVYEGADLPEKPVVITFDDGYLSNYELAWPILEQYGMKATIFAIGVSVGKDTYKDTGNAMTPHFSYEQAAEMAASGTISVQSHTYDMHQWAPFEDGDGPFRETILPLPGESEEDYVAALTADFTRSRSELEAATGQPVNVLAYPSGAYSTLTQATLTELGVRVTLSTNPGINTVVRGLPQTLCGMLRFGMNDTVTPEALLALLAG